MKVLVLFVFLAISGVMSQSAVTYSASVGQAAPSYGYAYNVNDPTTGDIKSHQEVRNGDAVSGSYSLVEADGSRRIVDYTADDQHGFNANVRHEGQGAAAAVVPVVKHVAPAYPYAYHAYPYYAAPSAYAYPHAASSVHHAYPYAAAYPAYAYAASAYSHPYSSGAAHPYASYPYTPYSYSYSY